MSTPPSTRLIQAHLDRAALQSGYLDVINGTTPESMIDAEMKMMPIVNRLAGSGVQCDTVVSVGVGQGEELHALANLLTNFRVVGVDIADSALRRARERQSAHDLDFDLVQSDGRCLPFKNSSVGGVVMSSILHEIYSYHQPGGFKAFQDAVRSATSALCDGGALYIREFACPPANAMLRVIPKTEDADTFTNYFAQNFQVGLCNQPYAAGSMASSGHLNSAEVMQMVLHFRNFWNDKSKGFTYLGDENWKEMRESYVVPNPRHPEQGLSISDYCDEIIRAASEGGDKLTLVAQETIRRRKTALFLMQHFKIYDRHDADITEPYLRSATSKLEALFVKL